MNTSVKSTPNPLPPGFLSFDPNDPARPLTSYQRKLPHWRQIHATYFLTFHTRDALPSVAMDDLMRIRRYHENQNLPDETLCRAIMQRTEHWLDQGHGDCIFADLQQRKLLFEALTHFEGERMYLGALTILPNHAHFIVRMKDDHELEKWLKSTKGFSARQANHLRGNTGSLWMQESYDRIIRDGDHLRRVLAYIGRNLEKAGLPKSMAFGRWVNPDWVDLGWGFPGR